MLESVVVLRHARAGDRATWCGDDLARPLDPEGLAESLAIVAELAPWPIDEVWTSPATRCQHTVAALAANRRVPVHTADWLLPQAEVDAVRAGLEHVAPSVLLCSHRELIPNLFAALGPLPFIPPPVLDKGAALAVRFHNGHVVGAQPLRPRLPLTVA